VKIHIVVLCTMISCRHKIFEETQTLHTAFNATTAQLTKLYNLSPHDVPSFVLASYR